MKLVNLKTCHMRNAFGIDEIPYFSWMIESNEDSTMQDAYRICVTDKDGSTVWDSGKVMSRQNAFISYAGKDLESRGVYTWTVTVWDNHGSEATESQSFEMALLHTGDWTAKWVRSPLKRKKTKKGVGKQDPATMFRYEFSLPKNVIRARVYSTCHGAYRLSVNGQRADRREFAPEHTVYKHYLCYQTTDITGLLHEGENVLGMYVGDGWYYCQNSLPDMKVNYQHAVLFQIEVTYADGSTAVFGSDDTVKAAYGPICSSDLYGGEVYNAPQEIPGWDAPGFDASGWKNGKCIKQGLENLRAQLGEPVEAVMELPVKEVLHSPKGEIILDFGQNICGRVRMRLDVPAGITVTLDHTETLDKDGNYHNNIVGAGGVGGGCDQRDIYTTKAGAQVYEPWFTFHGFRYVRVTGLESVDPNAFTAVVLSTVKDDIGSFQCSDTRINRLYENIRWSQRSNMLSIPTDCPQREKAGWTGDVQIYTKTAMLNEDMTAFYTRYLENVECDQDEFGVVPQVVPYNGSYIMMGLIFKLTYGTKGKATSSGWGDMAVITPYRMYETTGNTLILKKQYNSMRRWCDYVISEAKTGKPKKSRFSLENEPYLWDTGYHYGEWLVPSQNKNGVDMKNLKAIMASSSVYTAPIFGWISVSYFAKIARILGNSADESKYQAIADKMKNAIVSEMIDRDGNCISDMMGAYVLFLYFDLVPEQFRQRFAQKLVQSIEKNGGCLDTGFLATPYLLDTLTKIGRQDIARKLLWQDKCPSWLFEVDHGATTIWESWFGIQEDGSYGTLSMNHYSFGCVAEWMFKHITGIQDTAPGFTEIRIAPDFDMPVDYAERGYLSEQGRIFCRWERTPSGICMDVEIPCNTTAEIILPDGTSKRVGNGKYHF